MVDYTCRNCKAFVDKLDKNYGHYYLTGAVEERYYIHISDSGTLVYQWSNINNACIRLKGAQWKLTTEDIEKYMVLI